MAQIIAPEVWQDGIDDNQLLPNRYTVGLFTGRGINLANDGRACRVYDILTSDYITDYDDRRLNGLGYGSTQNFNQDGRDGWGASAYGVFQDVKFTSKVYAMGRHRSVAMRLFDEMQYDAGAFDNPSANPAAKYADGIGKFGDAGQSFAIGNGQALLKTAALMSKAKDRWQKQVLGPDIDKYVLFAIMNGHQVGRLVGKDILDGSNHVIGSYNDRVFDGDADHYQWVAQPGPVQGQPLTPSFAPIHCIEWDADHIPLMLQNVKVTWNNLFIDQSDRVVLIDPFYEYALLSALTGGGVPATDSAYTDMQNGSFTRLMGWDFNFEIPSNYWPQIYTDANLNVVHYDGTGSVPAFDLVINSISGVNGSGNVDDATLLRQLLAADRMGRTNWIRTDWNPYSGQFTKTLTNYPLGAPAFDGYYDTDAVKIEDGAAFGVVDADFSATDYDASPFMWQGQGAGYGLKPHDAGDAKSASGPQGSITKHQVIGCFLWKKAAQMSQEYSEMVTDEGRTRGKFQEMCMDVKYDAWVIENYSHGIIPIIAGEEQTVPFAIPVSIASGTPTSLLTGVTIGEPTGTGAQMKIAATPSYNLTPAVAPQVHYQWYKDGTATGTDSNELVIGAATSTPQVFKVVATAIGTATGTVESATYTHVTG